MACPPPAPPPLAKNVMSRQYSFTINSSNLLFISFGLSWPVALVLCSRTSISPLKLPQRCLNLRQKKPLQFLYGPVLKIQMFAQFPRTQARTQLRENHLLLSSNSINSSVSAVSLENLVWTWDLAQLGGTQRTRCSEDWAKGAVFLVPDPCVRDFGLTLVGDLKALAR